MTPFSGDLFDGRSSRAHPVTASLAGGVFQVAGDGIALACALDEVSVAPPVGAARGVVLLPEGAELHSTDRLALAQLSRLTGTNRPERWAHALEGRWRYAIAALAVSICILFVGLRWGVPAIAGLTAQILPPGLDHRLGEQSLSLMDRLSLSPSLLPPARQQALGRQLAAYCHAQACPPYRLLFRASPMMGANAMALPGGTIVVTDALVNLAHDDAEILAVVAHELGHVEHRHSLRLALQSIGAGVILVAVTGDVGSISDLAAGLPSLLLQSGYSRDMERQADAFALAWLNRACIPPRHFAAILGRLDRKSDTSTSLLDSHPGTQERIRAFLAPSRGP